MEDRTDEGNVGTCLIWHSDLRLIVQAINGRINSLNGSTAACVAQAAAPLTSFGFAKYMSQKECLTQYSPWVMQRTVHLDRLTLVSAASAPQGNDKMLTGDPSWPV